MDSIFNQNDLFEFIEKKKYNLMNYIQRAKVHPFIIKKENDEIEALTAIYNQNNEIDKLDKLNLFNYVFKELIKAELVSKPNSRTLHTFTYFEITDNKADGIKLINFNKHGI